MSGSWSSRRGGSRPPAGSAPRELGAVEATIAGKGSHGTVCRVGRVDEGDLGRGAAERQAGVGGQVPERPEGPGGRHPPAGAGRGPRRARDRSVVDLALSRAQGRGPAGGVHRRAAREGGARHGAEQDRRERRRRAGADRGGRLLPGGPGQGVRAHAGANAGGRARPAAPHLDPALQPDPRRHEDLRPDRAEGRRSGVRDPRPGPARDEPGGGPGRAAAARGVAAGGPQGEAWRAVRARAVELDRQLIAAARTSPACRRLMTIPGVGAVTAASFVAAVEAPENFRTSRAVGAWLGLTTRRHQSGEADYDGRISRRGDGHLRALVYEAAAAVLTRTRTDSALRSWGLKLKEKVGFKRAAVAVARKLAVVMHAMLKTGATFDPAPNTTA